MSFDIFSHVAQALSERRKQEVAGVLGLVGVSSSIDVHNPFNFLGCVHVLSLSVQMACKVLV